MKQSKTSLLKKKEKAIQLLNQGRLQEAKPLFQEICRKETNDLGAWMELGVINGQLGDFEASANCFAHVVSKNPQVPEAWFNLGNAHKALDRFKEAEQCFNKALALNPNWIQVLNNLGNLHKHLGRYENAAECYKRAIQIEPRYLNAQLNYSNLMQIMGFYPEAIEGYKTILNLQPQHEPTLLSLCNAYIMTNRLNEAMECCNKGLQANSHSIDLINRKAKVLELQGDKQAAYDLIEPLLKTHGNEIQIAQAFSAVCKLQNRCDEAISLLKNIDETNQSLNSEQRSEINFTVGELLDRDKRYDEAFKHYALGNQLKCRPYNSKEHEKFVDDSINVFTSDSYANLPSSTIDTHRPIFIVGMPRSGTTLVEQIISSHPDVNAAGELNTVVATSKFLSELIEGKPAYPAAISYLSTDTCNEAAEYYFNTIKNYVSDSPRATDKLPQNFLYLGLIHKLFPQAHIIHCQRNPMDTCISCYFQNFSRKMGFSFNLSYLGQYFLQYQRIMKHWQKTLNIPMLNVQYEEMVDNQEGLSRQIIDYLGLEWNDACLKFYENKRAAGTASYDQVKQPIYKKSVARWKHYEKHLGELIEILGPENVY